MAVMVSRPLIVASIAGTSLLAVVAVDLALDRAYFLDIKIGDRWVTFAEFPYNPGASHASYVPLPLDPNGTATLRVRGDNGYPWDMAEHYRLSAGTTLIAEGDLVADAWASAEAQHEVDASVLYDAENPYGPRASEGDAPPRAASVWIRLDIAGGHHEHPLLLEAPR